MVDDDSGGGGDDDDEDDDDNNEKHLEAEYRRYQSPLHPLYPAFRFNATKRLFRFVFLSLLLHAYYT